MLTVQRHKVKTIVNKKTRINIINECEINTCIKKPFPIVIKLTNGKKIKIRKNKNFKIISKTTIAIISCFKNESHIIIEWIEHYLSEGIDKFYLIDNGSTDSYLPKIQKYIDSGIVHLSIDPEKYVQAKLINIHGLAILKESWVLHVDLDEFMYSRGPFKTIKDYICFLPKNVSQVLVPWKFFGSSGYIEQPACVTDSFIGRKTNGQEIVNCKAIAKSKHVSDCNKIHVFTIKKHKRRLTMTSDGNVVIASSFANISETILSNSMLHLNHYAIQSYQFFLTVKMTRGDATAQNIDTLRNDQYFKSYDFNDVIDNELANKY